MITIKYADNLPAMQIAGKVNEILKTDSRVVITAPPGAGKSTVLPLTIMQGLPDDGKILMLEPRRLAARQIAARMSQMIGEPVGKTVGYRVRFDNKVSDSTRIEVLTESILTRMIVADSTIEGVSAIIFDEFHERNLASDIALALSLEAQQIIRPDLKIIIMSATIDAEGISRTLGAPIVESEGRMFHVDVIHSQDEATEQNSAEAVAHAIRQAHKEHNGDILAFLPGESEILRCKEMLGDSLGKTSVYPLYGLLSQREQNLAIAPSAEGERKVVLATSIAETSLTIEGVRIVIDSGLHRTMEFDPRSGLSHLKTKQISMDMANQRTGRAGRTAPGVCYRLWSLATEHRMDENRLPEILTADLTPMVLDITAWGEKPLESIAWLTTPPVKQVEQARELLRMLGAIADDGKITAHGRKMSSLPCHPRIAQMLATVETHEMKALAADIAALLEERDPLSVRNSSATADADINTRLSALRRARKGNASGKVWQRIMMASEHYRHIAKTKEDNAEPNIYATGMLLASAYPERIAMALKGEYNTFMLSCGNKAVIDKYDALSAYDNLAVAQVVNNRIILASPLDIKDLKSFAKVKDNISWDNRQGCIVAQREYKIGCLLIDSKPISDGKSEAIKQTICNAAQKYGTSMLNFSDEVQNLQRRVAVVAEWHPEMQLPDLSTEAVLRRADEWLPFYIGNSTTTAELKKIDLCEALWSLLAYEQQTEVERLAPTHIKVPTGSRIKIEYRVGAELPILRVRLQECFGMDSTPRIDDGKRAVLMELLSPGFKPVQLTQDLNSFWQNTYFEVRKELKRRYPKHSWPDNPLESEAVRGVKRNRQ
ncbi:MAG: ATP-dependent helicase HrpB [Bacteroidaceae bacterium]|nr:ATP-dependent helicase HrpB [Bacteroidaceae bacterium]